MKFIFLVLLFAVPSYRAFSQQCEGNACAIISVKKNPTTMVAWQFTNNSDSPVKIGLKRDLGGCSSTNYYSVAPHQQFNWGIGNQVYCLPFEAIFVNNVDLKKVDKMEIPNRTTTPPPRR